MRLLLIDAHVGSGTAVRDSLARIGHAVDWIDDHRGLDCAPSDQPSGCILNDRGSLDAQCGAVIELIRASRLATSIIVLGASRNPRDCVALLDQGADDHIAKPFDLNELAARIRSVTRRQRQDVVNDVVLTHGPLRLLPASRTATWNGAPISLSGKEFAVLEMFFEGKTRVLSRERLHSRLYGPSMAVEGNLVEVHIHHVRRKTCKELVRTVRGVGYELAAESELLGTVDPARPGPGPGTAPSS